MRPVANTTHLELRALSYPKQTLDTSRPLLLSVLQKISWLALYLILLRILSAAGIVIALWLCPVQIFANLGLYLAAVNLAALAVFGRYELLIIAAPTRRECADAVHLCIMTGAGGLAITSLVMMAVQHLITVDVLFLFTAALFARAWLRLGLTLATRYGRYDRAVKALLPHAIVQPLILAVLLYHGHNSLLAFIESDIIGQLTAATFVCVSQRRAFWWFVREPIRYRQISKLALVNLNLPTLNLTAAASAFLFAATPLFFLPGVSNVVLAGTLALLFRILDFPTNLTTSSLGPILLKEVADRNRGIVRVPWSIFLLPAIVATVVFAVISLGGHALNRLELAPSWHLALTVLPAVALFQAGIAATAPLIDIATLGGHQKSVLALNIAAFGLAACALLLWRNAPIFAIFIAGSIGFARAVALSAWFVGLKQWPDVAKGLRAKPLNDPLLSYQRAA